MKLLVPLKVSTTLVDMLIVLDEVVSSIEGKYNTG